MADAGLRTWILKGLPKLDGPGWRARSNRGRFGGTTTAPNPYCGFRLQAEVIQHAVWLQHCFSLGLHDVELILAARGVVMFYESIREWG